MDNNSASSNQNNSATGTASVPAPAQKTIPQAPASSNHDFSISEAIKYGFNFFKANLVAFIKLGVVLIVINIATSIITGVFKDNPFGIIWAIVSTAISVLVQIGTTKILLDLYDKKPLNFSNLYSQYKIALRFFVASFIFGVMVVIGLILFIVPGIYLAIRFQFYSFLIVDKNADIGGSFGISSKLSEGVKMKLFFFGLALIGLNLLGAIVLLVGLLVTIPTSAMATVYVYRKLASQNPGV